MNWDKEARKVIDQQKQQAAAIAQKKAKEEAEQQAVIDKRLTEESERCLEIARKLGIEQKLREIRDQVWKCGWIEIYKHQHSKTDSNGYVSVTLIAEWPVFVPYWEGGSYDGYDRIPAHIKSEDISLVVSVGWTDNGVRISLVSRGEFIYREKEEAENQLKKMLIEDCVSRIERHELPDINLIRKNIRICRSELSPSLFGGHSVEKPEWFDELMSHY